jgi:hypothetical protein
MWRWWERREEVLSVLLGESRAPVCARPGDCEGGLRHQPRALAVRSPGEWVPHQRPCRERPGDSLRREMGHGAAHHQSLLPPGRTQGTQSYTPRTIDDRHYLDVHGYARTRVHFTRYPPEYLPGIV